MVEKSALELEAWINTRMSSARLLDLLAKAKNEMDLFIILYSPELGNFRFQP
jgi:hypothetical protein